MLAKVEIELLKFEEKFIVFDFFNGLFTWFLLLKEMLLDKEIFSEKS